MLIEPVARPDWQQDNQGRAISWDQISSASSLKALELLYFTSGQLVTQYVSDGLNWKKHSTMSARWSLPPASRCPRNSYLNGKASFLGQLIWNKHLSLLSADNWFYKHNGLTLCFPLKESQLIQMIILLECSEFWTSDKWQSRNDKPRLYMDKNQPWLCCLLSYKHLGLIQPKDIVENQHRSTKFI